MVPPMVMRPIAGRPDGCLAPIAVNVIRIPSWSLMQDRGARVYSLRRRLRYIKQSHQASHGEPELDMCG